MNEMKRSCAPTDRQPRWENIDWDKCDRASTYCKGSKGRSLRQGQILAVAADPLVHGQSTGCETGDFQQREEYIGSGQGIMVYSCCQGECHSCVEKAGLQTHAFETGKHSQEQREITPVGNTHDERQSHAGIVSHGIRPRSRNYCGQPFLRIPQREVHG